MTTNDSLAESIALQQELIATIKEQSRQMSGRATWMIVRTFSAPLSTFVITAALGAYARDYVALTFQDGSLNLLTTISTWLATLVLTYQVWRWSERRFGGVAFIGRLFGVSQAVLRVEEAIQRAQQSEQPDVAEIETLAQNAWQTYVQAMRASGFAVDE
ncbi:MAG: hypothetical protein JNJ61_08750 [Anaerolineae bacterium]|nr:hypothetical protein [Anaerolineae bacterium]